jgi:hypothetical protein
MKFSFLRLVPVLNPKITTFSAFRTGTYHLIFKAKKILKNLLAAVPDTENGRLPVILNVKKRYISNLTRCSIIKNI